MRASVCLQELCKDIYKIMFLRCHMTNLFIIFCKHGIIEIGCCAAQESSFPRMKLDVFIRLYQTSY